MSSKSECNVVLKSYSSKKQDSIDAFFHEWQSIHQSQAANSSNANGNGSDEDVQEQDPEREQGVCVPDMPEPTLTNPLK